MRQTRRIPFEWTLIISIELLIIASRFLHGDIEMYFIGYIFALSEPIFVLIDFILILT